MPVKIYNIEKKRIESESVSALGAMRFLYENPAGALATWALVKRKFFSSVFGVWASSPMSAKVVEKFILKNEIDTAEMLKDFKNFSTFNEFFTRALRDDARPLENPDNVRAISFPSDGRHLAIENISLCDNFYIKGEKFNLEEFLGSAELAGRFEGGSALISRLSPVDYHRFHSPISGEIVARRLVNGHLYSVNPIALRKKLSIFWKNKRILNIVESPVFGMVAFVEIGATNVGGIENYCEVGSKVKRGEVLGTFKFGASCVMTIFEGGKKIKFIEPLLENSAKNIECYARTGRLVGEVENS